MSVRLSAAALDSLAALVTAPNYRAKRSQARASFISASAISIAPIRPSISTNCSTPARDRDWAIIGAGVRDADELDARRARRAGLVDDRRRAGGACDARACHRRDDRFSCGPSMSPRCWRCSAGPRNPHRLADDHRRRLLHFAGDAEVRSDPSRHRRGRANHREPEDRVRPDRRGAEAAARQRASLPFTVMSCDNIPGNGHVTENAVAGLAELVDPELGAMDPRNPSRSRIRWSIASRPRRPIASARWRATLRRRGRLAGVLRGVQAMGGRGQFPDRAAALREGRRHLHRGCRAL